MKRIEIFVVDDYEVSRQGICKLLNELPHFSIKGNFKYAKEAIKKVKNSSVDIIITDVNLSDIDVEKMVKKLKTIRPDLGILIFSSKTDVNLMVSLVKAGASSYLSKTTSLEELIHTIEVIHQGERYFSQKTSSILFQHLIQAPTTPPLQNFPETSITPRELEILNLIAEEYTNKEIAKKLFISSRTVDTHRRNLLIKLKAKNTAGLVKYFYNFKVHKNLIFDPSIQ